ncbi:MIF4G domain-containing protein B [Operophtera brumata]|uniref:MIF4G domain-containing protein B n=1 Tax=Operophtera brumata TaxID=104452 RepID=A0A0L7LUU6_OPEBR|nr:MIF4G domain-containing protein B [Operophtera brumata]
MGKQRDGQGSGQGHGKSVNGSERRSTNREDAPRTGARPPEHHVDPNENDPHGKETGADDLIVLTEAVAYQMMQGSYDRVLQSNVSTMYSNLKLYGAQLEELYKDFLDRYFVVFRNGSQDERLDKKTRLHLLELIELRAKLWQGSNYMSQYYRHRGTHSEGSGAGASSPSLAAPAEPPAMLGPGELIKPSGKFPKPTKIPGKNYSKDEVVIRNADSGKVMGIKGRRVHMIEELSDTIISFQRVRLESEEPALGGSRGSLDSGEEDAPMLREKSPHNSRALLHSFSTNDAALGEYKYTVTFGQHSIKITGPNLDLVKTAKLVLDEYFESASGLEAMGAGSGDFFTLSQRPAAALLLHDDAALNGHDDDVFLAPPAADQPAGGEDATPRRPRFSRAASTDKNQGGGSGGSRQIYTYETLLQYADSPLSKPPPAGLAAFPAELARKVHQPLLGVTDITCVSYRQTCLEFESASYLKKARAAGVAGTNTVSADAPDSPEPE